MTLTKFPLIGLELEKPLKQVSYGKAIYFKNKAFFSLLVVTNITLLLTYTSRFFLTLQMSENNMSTENILYLTALGVLLSIPFPYIYGILSKSYSNKLLLISTIVSIGLAMILLNYLNSPTGYLVIGVFISITTFCTRSLSQKIIYDIFALDKQAWAQTVLTTTNWLSAIVGFLACSLFIDKLGIQQIAFYSALLSAIAILVSLYKMDIIPEQNS
ncbi:MAG: MFS transporter [Chitinophagaceae bacterium]|nr:MFS transporter [Chitinophagaceae bacterium]